MISYDDKEFIVEDMTKAQKKQLKSDRPKLYEQYFSEEVQIVEETIPEKE